MLKEKNPLSPYLWIMFIEADGEHGPALFYAHSRAVPDVYFLMIELTNANWDSISISIYAPKTKSCFPPLSIWEPVLQFHATTTFDIHSFRAEIPVPVIVAANVFAAVFAFPISHPLLFDCKVTSYSPDVLLSECTMHEDDKKRMFQLIFRF